MSSPISVVLFFYSFIISSNLSFIHPITLILIHSISHLLHLLFWVLEVKNLKFSFEKTNINLVKLHSLFGRNGISLSIYVRLIGRLDLDWFKSVDLTNRLINWLNDYSGRKMFHLLQRWQLYGRILKMVSNHKIYI